MRANLCLWLAVAALVCLQPGAVAKEKKPKKEYLCATCQSVAHLLVKLRKSDKSGNTTSEIVKDLISSKETKLCNEDEMKFYADRLEPKLDAAKMVIKCKDIVPDNPNYKSASDILNAMVAKKPRSEVAKILCVDSGRCDRLWTKEEDLGVCPSGSGA
mmetsp:Transcript_123721/g.395887  ORF Transcript_123721/g.395887 Transcript_123721/m.395887 type:complete len:158 (+) Transcript_123721:101-574(+)